jgi:small subunit ribosomal protein S6
MNIECDQPTLNQLSSAFRFNDAVIRDLIIGRDKAVVEPSPLAKSKDEQEQESRFAPADDASAEVETTEPTATTEEAPATNG